MPFEIDNEKKKRHRRTATEIARHYKCPISDCPKSYGSEGSLNQHIKLKHPDYYAEMILQNNTNQSMAELGQGVVYTGDRQGMGSDESNGSYSGSEDEDGE